MVSLGVLSSSSRADEGDTRDTVEVRTEYVGEGGGGDTFRVTAIHHTHTCHQLWTPFGWVTVWCSDSTSYDCDARGTNCPIQP